MPNLWLALRRVVARTRDDLVEAVFPAACRACGRDLPEMGSREPHAEAVAVRRVLGRSFSLPLPLLCRACTAALGPHPTVTGPEDVLGLRCAAAFPPTPALFALVHALKYAGVRELGPWFGPHLAAAAGVLAAAPDAVLVPMPLHASRQHERGFNQSELLARIVAAKLGMPMQDSLLRKRRATRPQAQLPHAAREANVDGCFERVAPLPGPRTWILVDDVVTTGATARAAQAALGAPREQVSLLVLCRALDATT